jgi:hypothetical protein
MSVLRTTRGGKTVEVLLTNGTVTVGTGPGCQITLVDPAAAPRHCQIVKSDKGYVVRDTSGATGTLVNGKKIQEHPLSEGDVLQIGSEKFVYSEREAAPAPAASGPAKAAAPRRSMNASRAAASAATGTASPPARALGPRRMVPKPGVAARVHKDRATFTLPSTPKGRLIALTAAILLLAVVGILYAISSSQVDQEKLKADAVAEIQAWDKIPATDPIRKYDEAVRINGNPDYQKYARGEIRVITKIIPELKVARDRQVSADREARPFTTRFDKAKESPDEFDKLAEGLWDEVKTLLAKYQGTSYDARLTEIRDELKKYLEKGKKSWINEIPRLTFDVQKDINGSDLAGGMNRVTQFGTEFDEKRIPDLKVRLDALRDRLAREAVKLVVDKNTEARALWAERKRDEARKLLNDLRPRIKGFPDAEKKLDQCLNELK